MPVLLQGQSWVLEALGAGVVRAGHPRLAALRLRAPLQGALLSPRLLLLSRHRHPAASATRDSGPRLAVMAEKTAACSTE